MDDEAPPHPERLWITSGTRAGHSMYRIDGMPLEQVFSRY
jgi:hypothetical protein